jgi:hypothetical protein
VATLSIIPDARSGQEPMDPGGNASPIGDRTAGPKRGGMRNLPHSRKLVLAAGLLAATGGCVVHAGRDGAVCPVPCPGQLWTACRGASAPADREAPEYGPDLADSSTVYGPDDLGPLFLPVPTAASLAGDPLAADPIEMPAVPADVVPADPHAPDELPPPTGAPPVPLPDDAAPGTDAPAAAPPTLLSVGGKPSWVFHPARTASAPSTARPPARRWREAASRAAR